MSRPRERIGAGLRLGLLAGILVGTLEAIERSRAILPFVKNRGEALGFGLALLGYLLVTAIAAGLTAGVVVTAVERLLGPHLRRFPVRALLGALAGAALGAWTAWALTLTVRFDRLVAQWPLILTFGALAGTVGGLLWPVVSWAWRGVSRGILRGIAAAAIAIPLLALYLMDANFAPQSSYGVHVLLDTAVVVLAFVLAALLPRLPGRVVVAGMVCTLALTVWCDQLMRHRPRLANLVKTRSALAGRAIDLWRGVLDGDRDGRAPLLLVGGSDPDNSNPNVPPPVVDSSRALDLPQVPLGYRPPALPTSPHVLLLTIDALRHDVLPPDARPERSRLGNLLPALPRIAALAPRFARFDAAYTPSSGTEDTFNSLFSGAPLPGILAGIPGSRFLAARMRRAGYETRGFANYPLSGEAWAWPPLELHRPEEGIATVESAIAFLDSLPAGRPGLAWIHLMDLHADVLNPLSPDAYDHRAHLLEYSEGLARIDAQVGALMSRLDETGLAGRTVVFLSADHGEELGGHGHYHHNLSLYEPAIRVPLWATGPGVVPGPRHAQVTLVDLYPTLLTAAGVPPGRCAGRSLWPVLADVEPAASEPLLFAFLPQRGFSRAYTFSHHPHRGQAALIDPVSGHKVIVRIGDESWEAYDLSDRMERVSLAGENVAWVGPLKAKLDSVLARNSRPPSAP